MTLNYMCESPMLPVVTLGQLSRSETLSVTTLKLRFKDRALSEQFGEDRDVANIFFGLTSTS